MFEFLSNITTWYVDKNQAIGHKAALIIIIIGIALLVDNLCGFSFFYSNSKKIEQISEIEKVKNTYKSNVHLQTQLTQLEDRILQRKDIRQIAMSYVNRYRIPTFSGTNPQQAESSSKLAGRRSIFWHTLTSSFVFVLFLLLLPFATFSQATNNLSEKVIGFVVAFFSIGVVVFLNSYLLSLVPVIIDYVWMNYLINIFLHLFSIYLMYKISKIKK